MEIGGKQYFFRFFNFDKSLKFVGLKKMAKNAKRVLGEKATMVLPSEAGLKLIAEETKRIRLHGTEVKFGTLVEVYDENGYRIDSAVTFCSTKEKQINKYKGKIEAIKHFVSTLPKQERTVWTHKFSEIFPAIKYGVANRRNETITENEAATAAPAPHA